MRSPWGVAQDESDFVQGAQIREPVPGEHAFAPDDEPVAKGLDGREKSVGLGGQVLVEDDVAVGVANAEVHRPGMEIDATVVLVRLVVEAHRHCLLCDGAESEPASWLERATFLKIPRPARTSVLSHIPTGPDSAHPTGWQ